MTSVISKFQLSFCDITARHKILGSVLCAWGLSYRFHNCAWEGMEICPWSSRVICTGWHKSCGGEQKRGLGSRAPRSAPCCLLRPERGRQCDFSHCGQVGAWALYQGWGGCLQQLTAPRPSTGALKKHTWSQNESYGEIEEVIKTEGSVAV